MFPINLGKKYIRIRVEKKWNFVRYQKLLNIQNLSLKTQVALKKNQHPLAVKSYQFFFCGISLVNDTQALSYPLSVTKIRIENKEVSRKPFDFPLHKKRIYVHFKLKKNRKQDAECSKTCFSDQKYQILFFRWIFWNVWKKNCYQNRTKKSLSSKMLCLIFNIASPPL